MTRERTPLGRGDLGRDAERLDVLLGGRASALPPEAGGDMFSKIVLYHGDGANAEFFDVNDSGLAASIAAVTGTDTIAIPPAADATFTSAITIPANTAVQGTGSQTTFISNTVTMSSNSFLRDVTVLITANSGANLTGVAGPSDTGTTGYMNTVSIQITQSGAGDAYGVEMGAGDLFARSCFVGGTSTGGTGNGVKSGAGDIYIEEGSAVQGSSAAISGTNTYSIDSDKFIHLHDVTNTNYNWIFTADDIGLTAAITASASSDVIQMPDVSITGGPWTIKAGSELRGISRKTVLTGDMTVNGALRNIIVVGDVTVDQTTGLAEGCNLTGNTTISNGAMVRWCSCTASSGTVVTISDGTLMLGTVNLVGTASQGIDAQNATSDEISINYIWVQISQAGNTGNGIYADATNLWIANTFVRTYGEAIELRTAIAVTNSYFESSNDFGLAHPSGTAIVTNCYFHTYNGASFGVSLGGAGVTFHDCGWNSMSGIANVTWGQGDRGAYDVETFHARDIEAPALTRHNPATVAQGDIVIADSNPYWSILSVGAANTYLSSDGTDPSWANHDVGARVWNNGNISINDATTTVLTYDSERYDTDTIHSTASLTGRLTCKTAGKYLIISHVEWASNATGNRQLSLRLNAATGLALTNQAAVNGLDTRMSISTIYSLSVNDFVETLVYQNSGGALNVELNANESPEFMMQKIG